MGAAAKIFPVAFLAFASLGAAVAAPGKLSQQDKTWLVVAHQTNLAEIKAGKLAEHKGHVQSVITAGTTLATDHAMLDKKLAPAARKLGVKLPNEPTTEQKNHMKVFEQKAGLPFDQAWVHMEIGGHISAIEATKRETSEGSSPEVRKLAKKALPVLAKHLQILRHTEVELHGGG